MTRKKRKGRDSGPRPSDLLLGTMTPVEVANHAFEKAVAAFERALDADGHDPTTGLDMDKIADEYYRRLADVLDAYNTPGNWYRAQTPREHLPRAASYVAGEIVRELISGRMPLSIGQLFFKRKRPGRSSVQA